MQTKRYLSLANQYTHVDDFSDPIRMTLERLIRVVQQRHEKITKEMCNNIVLLLRVDL